MSPLKVEPILFPEIGDPDFEVLCASILRIKLSQKYHKNSRAHTSREVGEYVASDDLIALLRELEEAEYQGKMLSDMRRAGVIEVLKKL